MTTLTPLLAADAPSAPDPAHQRAEVRNNMFVVAVLYGAGGSVPVRVRNMSRGGALVESADTPGEGQHVRLSRGSLSVRGHIAWQRDNRAGIRFDTAIDVSDWLPLGARPTGQQRVDEIVQDCRAAAQTVHQDEAIRNLLDCRDGLNAVAEELAGDNAIATGHSTALQRIDVMAQMLDRLASTLAAAG